MQDLSDNYHTYDGVEITPNLRVWSPYTMSWGTVLVTNWKYQGLTDPGGQYFNGWWKIGNDDGTGALLNGTRMAHVSPDPNTPPDPQAT